jgi:hypothetical protein
MPRQKTGGRKKGTPNKATAAFMAEVAASGKTPLEVMIDNMRTFYADGDRMAAQECAKDAAPYIHPKLQAIEHSGDQKPIRHIIIARWKKPT